MRIDQRTLHGMERAVRAGEVFDCHDLGAVDHAEQQDAAIDGLVDDASAPVGAAHRDGTGTAVPLRAAFLGTDRTLP